MIKIHAALLEFCRSAFYSLQCFIFLYSKTKFKNKIITQYTTARFDTMSRERLDKKKRIEERNE